MAKEFLHKEGLTKLVENIKAWSKGAFLAKDATITKSSGTNKGVSVSIQGSVSAPSVSVSVTTSGVSENNSGIVSGMEVKNYVDANTATKDTFKAATSSSNAVNGLVPAPSSANATKFLRGDGSWTTPPLATNNTDGLMSSADKATLDQSVAMVTPMTGEDGSCVLEVERNDGTYLEFPVPKVGSAKEADNAAKVGGKDIDALRNFMFNGDATRYIPIGTDFDTLYGEDKCGFWNSYDNTDYSNCPTRNFGLLVVRINTSDFAQLLLPYDTGSVSDVIRYRSQYFDGNVGKAAWNDWRKITTDTELNQLISRIESGEIVAGNALCTARYTDYSNGNGYILVRLNNITAGYMMSISVKIYDQYDYREYVFTGYAYTDINTWYEPKCVLQCSIGSDTFGQLHAVHVGGTVSDGLWLAVKRYGYVSVDVSFNTAGFNPNIITAKDAFTISSIATLPSDASALTAVTTTYTDTDIAPISASNKGVSVALGGTVGAPTVSVTTTTGGVSAANSGVVSGAEVKDYVDANAATKSVFSAATSSSVGSNGLVPAPSSANATKFLRGDGIWATPIPVLSCTSESNSKAWDALNPTEWQTVKFYDVYRDGGPSAYGNIMEIAGIAWHWKPQLWFDAETGQMRVRNRHYNGSAYNGWRTVLDSVNYTEHLSSYATKDDITNGNITAAKATTADSANALSGKELNDLVQGGGTIKYIKVVTSLPANASNDTLYLIKQ